MDNTAQTENPIDTHTLIQKAERKKKTDAVVKFIFLALAVICASIIVFVVLFIVIKGLQPFFSTYTDDGKTGSQSFWSFLTNTTWNGGPLNYGGGYLIVNTLYLTILSLIVSIPLSLLTSILITRIAPKSVAYVFQSGIELLAAIPSVIYGLFGMGFINPIIDKMAGNGGSSVISGALVLALMSIPTMTLMSTTAIKAVNPNLIKASLALGASPTQTNFKIVLKDAQSGIFAGIILGIGRALGEATAVQMVVGNALGGIHFGLFDSSSTLTSQMLMGIGEATPGSLGYDIRFSAGIFLIVLILLIDVTLNHVKNVMYARRTGQELRPSMVKVFFSRFVGPKFARRLQAKNGGSLDD